MPIWDWVGWQGSGSVSSPSKFGSRGYEIMSKLNSWVWIEYVQMRMGLMIKWKFLDVQMEFRCMHFSNHLTHFSKFNSNFSISPLYSNSNIKKPNIKLSPLTFSRSRIRNNKIKLLIGRLQYFSELLQFLRYLLQLQIYSCLV